MCVHRVPLVILITAPLYVPCPIEGHNRPREVLLREKQWGGTTPRRLSPCFVCAIADSWHSFTAAATARDRRPVGQAS